MSGLAGLLVGALLIQAILCARPAPLSAWPARLLVQGGLLGSCLLARALAAAPGGAPVEIALAGMLALIAQAAWLIVQRPALARRVAPRPAGAAAAPVWPMLAAVLAAWLALRLLPEPALLAGARGVPSASLGIVLAGLIGALATAATRARFACLLVSANGLLLAGCAVAGPGWASLLALLPLQALALHGLCGRHEADPV